MPRSERIVLQIRLGRWWEELSLLLDFVLKEESGACSAAAVQDFSFALFSVAAA